MNELRQLPAIDRWLRSEPAQALCAEFGRDDVVQLMRMHLERIRDNAGRGIAPPENLEEPAYITRLRAELLAQRSDSMKPVINATGIIIHTNLGRAPLAQKALDAIATFSSGYSNLEISLDSGLRDSRYSHAEPLLRKLTGAEAALVVNNCAAAVMLALNTFALNGEVLVSRGELIEIGGSFRMPDVITRSGAKMAEVGTTNKTRLSDYSQAITDNTKVILSSHPSNYQISGFTEKPALTELAALATQRRLVSIQDLGSGSLVEIDQDHFQGEPTVKESIKSGIDLVMFSGDKMLGGPQCGILVGTAACIGAIKQNPMLRAMRIDKLSLAALAATLRLYIAPHDPLQEIPVLRMISTSVQIVQTRCAQLVQSLSQVPDLTCAIVSDDGFAGGGSQPMRAIPGAAVQLHYRGLSAATLARRMRNGTPAVVGRIRHNTVHLSLRTVMPEQIDELSTAVQRALR